MSKTKALIIIILIGLGIIVLTLAFYLRPVELRFDPDDISAVQVLNNQGSVVSSVNQTHSTVWLWEGDYSLLPQGDKIDEKSETITILKGVGKKIVNIESTYSESYLSSLEPPITEVIEQVLNRKYGNLMNNYEIIQPQLFEKGDWYTAILLNTSSTYDDIKDVYRFIAHESSGKWDIINHPSLTLYKGDFKEVPESVIESINNTMLDLDVLYY